MSPLDFWEWRRRMSIWADQAELACCASYYAHGGRHGWNDCRADFPFEPDLPVTTINQPEKLFVPVGFPQGIRLPASHHLRKPTAIELQSLQGLDDLPVQPGQRDENMSAKKQRMLSGAVAGMMFSLALPMTSNTGLYAPAAVEAAVGPKFSKPWLAQKKASFTAVKSYPLPDSLKFKGEAEASGYNAEQRAILPPSPSASSDSDEEVMQELNRMYQDNGQSSIQMASGRRENRNTQESKGLLGRLFDAVSRKEPDSSTPKTQPERSGGAAPDSAALVQKPSEQKAPFFEPNFEAEQGEPNSVATTEPQTPAPAAEIIIPPQPQPHLLPGFDVADKAMISPAETAGPTNDPFPLPPLPEGFDTKTSTAQLLPGFSLPPLPGEEFEQSPEPAAVVEIETPAPQSAMARVEAAPAVHPLEEDDETVFVPAPAMPMAQAESDDTDPFAASENELLAQELAAGMSEQDSSGGAMPDQQDIATSGKPRGERETNLPLAPSSRLTQGEWRHKQAPATSQPELTESSGPRESQPASGNGWKSRTNNVASQEPNTLNIPEGARPAELPQTRTARRGGQDEKYLRIAERGERTGFKGFCPVALRDDLELLDASPEFRTEFEGQVYYFSSNECLTLFQNDPIRYVPAQGGIDLVKYLQQGTEEPGRLDFAVWYQDRLFLFASQTTLEQFREEPAQFVQE